MQRRLGPTLIAACLILVAGREPALAQSAPASATREGDPEQIEVFRSGDGGYHTYRIPAIVLTPGGHLVAFAEARRAGQGDTGDIDLVSRRSEDGGRTWSSVALVGDNGPNTFGNPCPVVDRSTGTIWLLTTHNPGDAPERDILAGTSRGTRTVWVLKSTDDGRTWSAPVEITASVKRPDWTWYATGPGIGVQLRSGRLVIPANHAIAGTQVHRAHLFYSDDHGATWQIGAVSVDGTNESQVVELADGRVLLNSRNHPPRAANFRMVSTSHDGGLSLSAAAPDPALPEPPAQASLIRHPGGTASSGAGGLLFSNPSGPKRSRMTVRVSQDEGRTWPILRVLHEGPAAYSCLVVLPDGTIGVLYERGDRTAYERITFARVGPGWLTGGTHR